MRFSLSPALSVRSSPGLTASTLSLARCSAATENWHCGIVTLRLLLRDSPPLLPTNSPAARALQPQLVPERALAPPRRAVPVPRQLIHVGALRPRARQLVRTGPWCCPGERCGRRARRRRRGRSLRRRRGRWRARSRVLDDAGRQPPQRRARRRTDHRHHRRRGDLHATLRVPLPHRVRRARRGLRIPQERRPALPLPVVAPILLPRAKARALLLPPAARGEGRQEVRGVVARVGEARVVRCAFDDEEGREDGDED